jgi:hypothetical protein
MRLISDTLIMGTSLAGVTFFHACSKVARLEVWVRCCLN